MEKININNLFSQNAQTKVNSSSKSLNIYSLFNRDIPKKDNFSIDKLINIREKREKKIIKEYRKKYRHCLDKIEETNNLDKYDTVYIVPMAMYDHTDYDPEACIEYIDKKLKKYYMDTLVLSSNKIFISWNNIKKNRDADREEKNRIKQIKENNIEQE